MTFLRQGQCAFLNLCMGKMLKKNCSQSALKTNSCNLQCVIKIVKFLITIKILSNGSYTPLPLAYEHDKNHVSFKCLVRLYCVTSFSPNLKWSLLLILMICSNSSVDIDDLFKWFTTIEQGSCRAHIY